MKVIYIVDFPIEGNSGKNKATREKAKALQKLLGESNLIFIHPPASNSSLIKILNRLFFDFRVFFKLLFRKKGFIIIQRVLFMPFSRLLFFLKGAEVISEFHADFKEEIPFLNKSVLEKKILHVMSCFYNLNYHLSTAIIFNHPYLKEKFDPIFKKPSIYSYNGSNVNEFSPMSQFEARKTLRIDQKIKMYLFLGSVSQWHGVDYLIDLFNQQQVIDDQSMYLYIVGAGNNSYVNELKRMAENKRIIFIPPVSMDIGEKYINAADFCMLPVKQIRTSPGSPLKLYDYIACGKPVITQEKVLGYSDEIEKYKLGYVVDFTNVRSVAQDLMQINNQANDNFYKNNLRVATDEVNWDNRIKEWIAFLIKIHGGNEENSRNEVRLRS